MGLASEPESPAKTDALHVEKVSTSSRDGGSEHLEDLDSIEQTQSGRYAWLVAITAGVGGLLFGMYYEWSRFWYQSNCEKATILELSPQIFPLSGAFYATAFGGSCFR